MKTSNVFAAAAVLLTAIHGISIAGDEAKLPEIAGVLGMSPVTDSSCAAVWIPVGETDALAGLLWYNNDGFTVFPEVLVASGEPNDPVGLADADLVAETVTGVSSGWSTIEFSEPVASRRGGFYVLFRFPEGDERVATGAGGGAGIGFVDGGGCPGWMTADGTNWAKVGRSYGFAVVPRYVPREDGMLEKSGFALDPSGGSDQTPQVFETVLLPAAPNPFNPSTDIRFALKDDARVEITLFDVRGRKVVELVGEEFPAGEHAVTWTGRDARGNRVASGVYFVQFRTGGVQSTRRIMMVK